MGDDGFQLADSPEDALQNIFGYESFRPAQREIIDAVGEGKDQLAIMPTGSGKSLCYQLPACLLDKTVLVVSPLIALMEDQLAGLQSLDIPSTVINSNMSRRERNRRIDGMISGRFRIVYVAPERFRSDRFLEAAQSANIGLLAIDEAHCISHWGHDFRPDYLALGDVRDELDEPPVLALTATATRQVRQDILDQLGLEDAEVVIGGFERPNLFFDVHQTAGDKRKMEKAVEVLEARHGESAVVYCATRRQVEDVSQGLEDAGLVVGAYHAGLSGRRRSETQDAFMAGDLPVLVATNAFGMGVDKPDIRTIIHYNITGSLEAYYQEAGRAGRDGDPAHCLMLYDSSDRGIHDFFIENSYPEPSVVEAVWREVAREGMGRHEIGPDQIAENISRSGRGVNVHSWAVETSLKLLRKAGHLDFGWQQDRPYVEVKDRSRKRDLRVDWDRLRQQREVNEKHLDDVINYAKGKGCRQAYMLHYFGASPSFGDQCGRCDACGERAESMMHPPERGHFDDGPETVLRKALSAVARTRENAGVVTVAALLRGSESEAIQNRGFDDLSTWGALETLTQVELVDLLRHSVDRDYLRQAADGQLGLTDAGVAIMSGRESVPPNTIEWIENQFDCAAAAS